VATPVAGLVFSIYVAYRIGQGYSADKGQIMQGLIPIVAFLTVVTVAFLRLYLG